jgi:predicted glycosyltransferase involved in capsule biosynthesis
MKPTRHIFPDQLKVKPDMKSKVQIPSDFDWKWYLKLNTDLSDAGLTNEADAVTHWLRWGFFEGREYKKPVNTPVETAKSAKVTLDNIFDSNIIDYDKIRESGIFDLRNGEASINFVIPIRNRTGFLKKTVESVKIAAEKFLKGPSLFEKHFSSGKINITVCEHSAVPEHRKTSALLDVDYMWIESHDKFNKCLAMNTAVFFSPKTEWIIFHDVDCVVQSDFFINVFKNIHRNKCSAIQTFSDRRVLYLDESRTKQLLLGNIALDDLRIGPGISPPLRPDRTIAVGAPGGSVCVTRDLFFKIGGYDPYYFVSYAPEDIFFWLKAEVFEKFETCTLPRNEIYHLNHEKVKINSSELAAMEKLRLDFEKMSKENKEELLTKMSNNIKKYE